MGRRPELKLNDQKIKELYLTDCYTCKDLAKKFGCTDVAIRNHLVAQGVRLRKPGKWKFKYPKRSFDGGLTEEAYMVGFRIGDLHVFKERPQSRAITVRSHTTHQAQVKLFESLFSKYSTVVTRKMRDGTLQSRCFVDLTFEFLLQKRHVPRRYQHNNEAAWAFIAGYTDAEGNIILNQGRARFKIDSYDFAVLDWIHKFLLRKGINSKFRRIAQKGSINTSNPRIHWKQDLWRLNVNTASDLFVFLNSIKVYMLHEKRLSDLRRAIANIKKRGYGKY